MFEQISKFLNDLASSILQGKTIAEWVSELFVFLDSVVPLWVQVLGIALLAVIVVLSVISFAFKKAKVLILLAAIWAFIVFVLPMIFPTT